VKSSVQISLKVAVGSRVLVSRLRARFLVLSPLKALLGIVPTISTSVALEKSAANEKEMNSRLVLVAPPVEPRETCKLRLELSVESEIEANAPSLVNLKCVVWAINAIGKNATTAIKSSFFIVGLSFELL